MKCFYSIQRKNYKILITIRNFFLQRLMLFYYLLIEKYIISTIVKTNYILK
jgi:hypothetical protein